MWPATAEESEALRRRAEAALAGTGPASLPTEAVMPADRPAPELAGRLEAELS